MWLISILILLIIFIVTAYYYYRFHCAAAQSRTRIPGPEPEWIFGNLRNTGITSGRTLHEVYYTLKQKYGDAFSFWLGPDYHIVFSRLEHVQYILTNRQIYDMSLRINNTFGVLFPNGLIALRDDAWKRHARFMLPMFKRSKVLPYLDAIAGCIDNFIEQGLVKQDGQIRTDLISQCQNVLLNTIALIAFDYDLESSVAADGFNLQKSFTDYVHKANQFILLSWMPMWLGKLILSLDWKYQRALRVVKHYVMNIITEEQQRQKQEYIASDRPRNLISSLVSSTRDESSPATKSFLTPEEVFDEVSLSILGGFETTSTTLSWFIFYMSKYPDVQQKIKDELKTNNLFYNTPLTQDRLDSLIYVECVTKEVLRFAPIAGAFTRQATCDDMIDNIPIKKGDIVIIASQNLHLDPRYWKIDPTKFIPERFLSEDKYPPQYAYMPFGGGHRACAGQDLAFFELKIAITRLMQRVTFEDPGNEADNSGQYMQRITCFPKHLAVRVRIDSDEKSD